MRNIVFGLAVFSILLGLRTAQAKYSGGTGEPNDPYRISDYNDLYALADDTNDYNKCFVMTADIDLDPCLPGRRQLTTALIAPAGGAAFTGTFDGNDCNILNLTIDTNGLSNDYLGLFGKTDANCAIESLGIEEVRITSGAHLFYLGGLVGRNNGSIRNCHVTGAVTADDFAVYVGGLVGSSSAGSIKSCYATGSVSAGYNAFDLGGLVGSSSAGSITSCHASGDVRCGNDCMDVGGLVGSNFGSITDCYAIGDVNAPGGFGQVGGLVGSNGDDATAGGSITGCYATGVVSSTYDVGGLVGLNAGGAIALCYATGAVSGSYEVGGLVGWNDRSGLTEFVDSNISDCYATGNVSGVDYVGGLAGINHRGPVSNSYATGSVSGSDYVGGLVGEGHLTPITGSYFLDPNDGGGPDNGYGEPLTDSEMKQQASFMNWDFNDIWKICDGEWYPQLMWEKYAGGMGTEESPYQIRTYCDLYALADDVNDYNKCFVMTADIDLDPNLPGRRELTTALIAPDINDDGGFQGTAFSGTFDGNDYGLLNLTIDTNGLRKEYLGLFGQTAEYCVISNLDLEDVSITTGDNSNSLGGLVGYSQGGSINNCHATGSVAAGDFSNNLGGLVGGSSQGSMSNCSVRLTVAAGYASGTVGGLVGMNGQTSIDSSYAAGSVTCGNDCLDVGGLVGINYASITDCYAMGDVNAPGGFWGVGGLVGSNGDDATAGGNITGCYATGSVSASYDVGGLVGLNAGGAIADCYATGAVSGHYNLGGLVGWNAKSGLVEFVYGSITDCYARGSVDGVDYVGGLAGDSDGSITSSYFLDPNDGGGPDNGYGELLTDAEMKQQASFVAWDFDDVWAICEGTNYPRHIWSIPAADFLCPDGVNFVDYSYFTPQWLASDCNETNGYCSRRDLDESGIIDEEDLKILCGYWLDGI